MDNVKHYPTHPGAEHPPTMCMEIPLEEYENLNKENAELKAQVNAHNNRANLWHYNAQNEHNANVALRMENESLKRENAELKAKLESAQASMYADVVDAGMENRRLKRALWLARAERAKARKNYWYARSCHDGDKDLWSIDGSAVKYIGCIKRTNFDWLKIWGEVETKCRAKAEEYK